MVRDQFLGNAKGHLLTSVDLVTAAAVAAGGHICVGGARFSGTGSDDLTLAGGGLTWTRVVDVVNGSLRIAIWVAYAPSGLASGTTLTMTLTNGTDCMLSAQSYTGGNSSTVIDGSNNGTGSTAAWSSGSVFVNVGDAEFGCAFCDGLVGSSIPTNGVEITDFNDATQTETYVAEDIASAVSASDISGTWSGAVTWISAAIAIQANPDTNVPIINSRKRMKKRYR
jgi:hypothetical protein